MKYGLHGKLQATEGKGDELAAILLKASELVEKKSSCHLYLVAKDSKDPDCIWVTEVWDTKEAHDQSLKMEEIKSLINEAMPILKEMPSGGAELIVMGGMGWLDQ